MNDLHHAPCGMPLPNRIHAVSVSLPRLADLIAYERQEPRALEVVTRGYPRFHLHPYVRQLREHLSGRYGAADREPPLVVGAHGSARQLCEYAGIPDSAIAEWRDVFVVSMPDDESARAAARAFLQHTGSGISSRRAEALLRGEGLPVPPTYEERETGDVQRNVRAELARVYGASGPHDVFLGAFGMSALHAVYAALRVVAPERRDHVHFGWLFMDTMAMLAKLTPGGGGVTHSFASALDVDALAGLLAARGREVGAIFLETPSNPLMRTPDVRRVRALADKHGCAVVIDATLGTPHNVDVLRYADVVVESLTKYACGTADVMMGAVVLNAETELGRRLRATLPDALNPAYHEDVARMAHCLAGYERRMEQVNANTMALAELFEEHPAIRRTHWAYAGASRGCYEAIHRGPGRPGGIITLELERPLESVYDRLALAKGPSLGAEFTLVGPYLYHAHYDLVSSETGRQRLAAAGLDPELLRVSVGVEPLHVLVDAFTDALGGS